MVGVITGDIINSKKVKPSVWLKTLKKVLDSFGESPKNWEIFRGDSFQIEVSNVADLLDVAFQIKAAIKTIKGLDVRLSLGLGDKTYASRKITQSNGSAFVRSGELIEDLKKMKINLAINSGNEMFDNELNLYLKLALVAMDSWLVTPAETVLLALQNRELPQEELGKILGIKQNAVSARLKRSRYYELLEVNKMFQLKLAQLQ
jgi:hypothetical protein